MLFCRLFLVSSLLAATAGAGFATTRPVFPADSLSPPPPEPQEVGSLLLYNRLVRDSRGALRFDQNVVPNIRLSRLLRLELGFRFGERPHHFDSYYHYKVELQTRFFWNTVRFIGRMSTNVINFPEPAYTRSNYLFITEGKRRLTPRLMALGGVGYLTAFQQNGTLEGLPVSSGLPDNHVVYKLTLRYGFSQRGFVEASYGTYDVFNPYRLSEPFAQVATDYELSRRTTLNAYLRYQADQTFARPLNEFLGLGVRLHLFRE